MNTRLTRLLILPGGPLLNQDQMASLQRHFEVIVGEDAATAVREGAAPTDLILRPVDRSSQRLAAIDTAGQALLALDAEAVKTMNSVERLKWLEGRLIAAISGVMGFDHFEVRLINRQTTQLELVIAVGLKPMGIGKMIFARAADNGTSGYVAATGKTYLCRDTRDDERYQSGLEASASALTVPLALGGEVIGVLNLESERPDSFDDEQVQAVEALARYLAIALHLQNLLVAERAATRHRAAETLREELDEPLTRISASAAELREKLDLDAESRDTLDRITDSVRWARTALEACVAGPKSLLGCEPSLRHHDAFPQLTGCVALVVDDDPSILQMIRGVLEEAGCQVASCEAGGPAMAIMEELARDSGRLDVVISDVKLPDLNGFEVFLAARERFPRVPVILMTGFGYDPHHSVVRASQEGLHSILFKPFRANQLLEEVNRAVEEASK